MTSKEIDNINSHDLLIKEYEIINKEYSDLCLNTILNNKEKRKEKTE